MTLETQGSSALTLRGVTKRYGDSTVVDQLDLELGAGEFVSLLGPSGCGKTTTLRMIAGFEDVDGGEVILDSEAITHLPANKREVNTVFQSYALFPHLTVSANIAYGLRQRRVPKAELTERVREALALVQLEKFAERKPEQLSGGQQQRVALARALVNRPKVLLLDEPLAALDRQLREEVQIELRLIQKQLNTTFLFVTHDQHEALAMSDRVAIMNGGCIEQVDTPEAVYSKPATRFVAGFVGQQNFFENLSYDAGNYRTSEGVHLESAAVVDGAVTAAVRPESVRISSEDVGTAAEANRVQGVVEAVSYLGDTRQYVLRTDAGRVLIVRSPRANELRGFNTGERVSADWRPEDLALFTSS